MSNAAKKTALILYPAFFAVSPILYFFSVNKSELSLGDKYFLLSLGLSLAVTGALWAILKLLLKDGRKAAGIVSLFLVLFFCYGHVRALIGEFSFKIAGIQIGPDKTLLTVWGIALLAGVFLLVRAGSGLRTLTNFLNVIGVFLVLIPLIDIVPYEINVMRASRSAAAQPPDSADAVELSEEERAKLPDIYYLIFDRYGSESSLEEYFGFDNGEFIDSLREKGFYVASKSFANYPRTFHSLASSLNMKHILYLTEELGEDFSSIKPTYEMMQDYKIQRLLKAQGYKYIHFGDWYPGTKVNRYADMNVDYMSFADNEFVSKLLKTTVVEPIFKKLFRDDPRRVNVRKRLLFKFQKLTEMPELEGPKFVFAHMLIPHDPYVFDKDGSPLTEEEVKKRGGKESYLNQLIFANTKIKEFVEAALEKSARPPIIVIQADEGPFTPEWSRTAGGPEDLRKISDSGLRVHSRILNAYYLPGVNAKKILYQSITPVNSFRVIFNGYFDTDYELLPDECYIFERRNRPYKFVNVTDKVDFD